MSRSMKAARHVGVPAVYDRCTVWPGRENGAPAPSRVEFICNHARESCVLFLNARCSAGALCGQILVSYAYGGAWLPSFVDGLR